MVITLYEAAPKLLANMLEESAQYSLTYLKEMGIQVALNSKVKEYIDNKIYLEDGTEFPTDTVIWTAGVKGNPVKGLAPNFIVGGQRIAVDEFNQIKGLPNVFSIGDVATHCDEENPKGLPMLAEVAMQQGSHLAKNLESLNNGITLKPFAYFLARM